MSTLPEFLLDRIAEDEEWARLSAGPYYSDGEPGTPGHSARVLAECGAKRRTLALLDEVNEQGIPRLAIYTRELLPRLLALPYADHPDYDEAWRL